MDNLARWYDTIFADKPYTGEVAWLASLYGGDGPATVFDIGCGTGNHALAFQARGTRVWGTDLDADMLAVAEGKGVTTGEPPEPVDMAVAMFHVANYCNHVVDLDCLFAKSYEHTRPGGLFAFDVWDAELAYLDPPRWKEYEHDAGEYRVKRVSVPSMVSGDDQVTVSNDTTIWRLLPGRLSVVALFTWHYAHRLWSTYTLADRLEVAGFADIREPQPWGRRSVLFTAVR